jgi:hypothetical protein
MKRFVLCCRFLEGFVGFGRRREIAKPVEIEAFAVPFSDNQIRVSEKVEKFVESR